MKPRIVKSQGQLYKNKQELRKEVERRIGHRLEEGQWFMLEPDFRGPYKEKTVRDTLEGIPRRKVMLVQDSSEPLVPKVIERWFQPFRQWLWECLELSEPMNPRKLGIALEDFRVDIENESGYMRIDYAIAGESSDGISVWETTSIPVTNKLEWLVNAKNHIDNLASLIRCPSALLWTYFLCEPQPCKNKVTAVLDDRQVKIVVDDPSVSAKLIAKAYSLARKQMVSQRNRRRVSQRKETLYEFIAENLGITWGERLGKWNSLYPQWKYNSVESMQVVCSRAKERPYDGLLWSTYRYLRKKAPRVFRQKELWDMAQEAVKQAKEEAKENEAN